MTIDIREDPRPHGPSRRSDEQSVDVEEVPSPIALVRGVRRRNTQFDVRREEIVDLAADLFAQRGYDATGIRDIGEAANLARGALYYYIDSKESLLNEIHDRVLNSLLESARGIIQLALSPPDQLRRLSEALLREMIGRPAHVWVFLHEYRALTGDRQETFERKQAEYERIVSDLFAMSASRGLFEIRDIHLTTKAFLGMHNDTYRWAGGEMRLDSAVVSAGYCDLFFRGLEPRLSSTA